MASYITPSEISDLFPEITDDEDLQAICDEVTTLIDEYCYTSFSENTVTGERLDSKQEISTCMGPIISVTSLKDDGTTLDENVDFYVYKDYIYIEDPSDKRKGILITYKYGYSEVPQIVKWVARDLAQYKSERPATEILFKTQKGEDFSYTMDEGLVGILASLEDYKRPRPKETSVSGDRRHVLRVGVI